MNNNNSIDLIQNPLIKIIIKFLIWINIFLMFIGQGAARGIRYTILDIINAQFDVYVFILLFFLLLFLLFKNNIISIFQFFIFIFILAEFKEIFHHYIFFNTTPWFLYYGFSHSSGWILGIISAIILFPPTIGNYSKGLPSKYLSFSENAINGLTIKKGIRYAIIFLLFMALLGFIQIPWE